MARIAAALAAVALLAGCGGGGTKPQTHRETPTTALLTDVRVAADSVIFEFESEPLQVTAAYRPRSRIAEAGSGARVPLKGTAYLVVHFQPAATADIRGENVVPTYTGPKRLPGPGPVLETVKISDFEADLAWAIGLSKRLLYDVSRDGSTVTVSFG